MRRRRNTSEFFLCFSSRSSSSSSMKISSKSILSPGRTREPTLSVSSSLSRRLSRRSSGSMKGGGGQAGQASPMFATGSVKKKGQGGSFEPAEPSSPKVTCIGQVRVKSKKKHGRNKLRNGSQRRNGEVSFRKTEQNQGQQECLPHRNQRWVHLPLSICETLRAFGAEFNCFVPCGWRSSSSSSCSWSGDREKVEKRRGTGCGAVFARWLFALQESEDKGRKIEHEHEHERENEIVVRDQENEHTNRESRRDWGSREVVSEIEVEILEEKIITKMESFEEEEGELELEEARKSICIPPKNALLLMRSRSAPFRISSLANRFWDSPSAQDKDVEEDLEDKEHEVVVDGLKMHNATTEDKEVNIVQEERECGEVLKEIDEMQEPQNKETEEQEEILVEGSTLPEALEVPDKEEKPKLEFEEAVKEVVEKKEEKRVSFSSSTMYFGPESETDSHSDSDEEVVDVETDLEERDAKSTEEEETSVSVSASEEEKEVLSGSTTEEVLEEQVNDKEDQCQDQDQEEQEQEEEEEEEKSLLPECLLLMMCEPKLSMEVSKETWVCSRDFMRSRHSEKKNVQKKDGDESSKKRLSTDSNPIQPPPQQSRRKQQLKQAAPVQIQPPRSSCSRVEPLVARAIEKKAANAGAYEPFVLKRCKSEPMRNSAKLASEVCFWQTNKLETHQPPTLGLGATGIGF